MAPMEYSLLPLLGLLPLRGLYLLIVIWAIAVAAILATYWTKRRVHSARLDDETVERLKNLRNDRQP